MTEQQVQKLRDAGISDEVITDMMRKEDEGRSEGYIDPATPSTTYAQAQATGTPTQGPEQTWSQTGTELALLTPDIAKAVGLSGAGYGAYKLLKGRAPAPTPTPAAAPAPATVATPAAFEARPVAPTAPSSGQQFTDWYKQGVKDTALRRTIAPMSGSMAMAPMALPYLGAAYEQSQIRANPNAPEYQNNPYAMMTRGQAATQGAAGAMNRRQAIGGQQYGGLTPEQQQMLDQDRIDQAIRRKAAEKVLGPVVPPGY